MKKRILPQSRRSTEWNEILRRIRTFSDEPETLLVRHLIVDKNYTLEDIAKIRGVSREAIRQKYGYLLQEKGGE